MLLRMTYAPQLPKTKLSLFLTSAEFLFFRGNLLQLLPSGINRVRSIVNVSLNKIQATSFLALL